MEGKIALGGSVRYLIQTSSQYIIHGIVHESVQDLAWREVWSSVEHPVWRGIRESLIMDAIQEVFKRKLRDGR